MKKVKVMYHGERVNHFDKIYQVFKSKDGKTHNFTGIKNIWFGSVYVMEKDTLKRKPEAIETDWQPTDQEREEYEAAKIVVKATRQNKLKAMKLKQPHQNIVRAIELIRPFYLHLSNLDRRRFIEWFENECSKKKGKKK